MSTTIIPYSPLRKLPIGIQSFEKLRSEGFLYVDKTALAYRLIKAGNPCFLSRPRRFGKSLLLSTFEAYFEVKKDANRPFYVHTEAGKVRVLGTAFNVCAYSNDRFWQTTLFEGSVMINQEEKEVLLKPNEQYQIDVRTGKAGLREVLPELYTSWRDGKFYFKAYTFEELVEKLERWYDFKMFYMNEEIKTRRFSGVVNKYQPLEEKFKFLQMTSDVQFNVKGNVVTASLKNR